MCSVERPPDFVVLKYVSGLISSDSIRVSRDATSPEWRDDCDYVQIGEAVSEIS